MLSVEAAMRHYARRLGGDVEQWGVTGLLHDFDYERWPDPPSHTREGARILREMNVDDEIVGAILSHAEWNHDSYPLDRPIRKALSAVDELCGFIYAVALVRPTRLDGMEPSSVKKKLKTPQFAAAVNREDIRNGAALLELPLEEHISNCITAMRCVELEIGLAARTG
ncbi:MAG: HDIG domain-containing protein [Phycisphaerae bacterium]|nr:HDIG domain-containing protein [Phycisphaerae bacterium]